jgi:hypothetical protein
MLFHSYLKNGIVYVPTVTKLTTGFMSILLGCR